MFGSLEKKPQGRIDSLIGAGTLVEGGVRFSGGLRIDGEVKGSVESVEGADTVLVLSEHARIEGAVRVRHLIMNGTVIGPVIAAGSLEMQSKARIVGDVEYSIIEIHQGAVIEGRLVHRPENAVELKLSASN